MITEKNEKKLLKKPLNLIPYQKYSENWITNNRIMYQKEKKLKINNSLLYKIEYKINNETKIIFRRYTTFEIFRKKLREFFPCHFIFPVHYKKIVKLKRKKIKQNLFAIEWKN